MRCYICDREDDLITQDRTTHQFSPCTVCMAIIEECAEGFEEKDEDAVPA